MAPPRLLVSNKSVCSCSSARSFTTEHAAAAMCSIRELMSPRTLLFSFVYHSEVWRAAARVQLEEAQTEGKNSFLHISPESDRPRWIQGRQQGQAASVSPEGGSEGKTGINDDSSSVRLNANC